MKKMAKRIVLICMALTLALSQAVFAEENGVVKGIFEKLTAPGSAYSEMKESYAQAEEGIAFSETLGENGFTVEITGSEEYQGSWTFTMEDGCLKVSFPESDFMGGTMAVSVASAAADYYGLDAGLVTRYLEGLDTFGLESSDYRIGLDETGETQTVSVYAAGPFAMKELDGMILNDEVLEMYGSGPLDAEPVSTDLNAGKISMTLNGSQDGAAILLAEYGELDDAAFKSLAAVVGFMKPAGAEAFLRDCAELKDAQGEGWSVTLNPDEETIRAIRSEPAEGWSCAVIRLGSKAAE